MFSALNTVPADVGKRYLTHGQQSPTAHPALGPSTVSKSVHQLDEGYSFPLLKYNVRADHAIIGSYLTLFSKQNNSGLFLFFI